MRINRHQMFMEMAHVAAKRSTCFRENVGCIIVRDNKVISIGYNGPKSGEEHCTHHPNGQCKESVHAEVNAIKPLINNGIGIGEELELYVTHLPCPHCTQLIVACGFVKRVFFQTMYGDSEPIYKILDNSGISLHRVMPSGALTSHNREELYSE